MATDYGILALGYLSQQAAGRHASAKEISEAYRIPPELTAKILQKFAKCGLVKSQAGPTGGYALTRSAAEITVSDVIFALEGPVHLVKCLSEDLDCGVSSTCDIAEPMRYVRDRVLQVLGQITLEEIQTKGRRSAEGVRA